MAIFNGYVTNYQTANPLKSSQKKKQQPKKSRAQLTPVASSVRRLVSGEPEVQRLHPRDGRVTFHFSNRDLWVLMGFYGVLLGFDGVFMGIE